METFVLLGVVDRFKGRLFIYNLENVCTGE